MDQRYTYPHEKLPPEPIPSIRNGHLFFVYLDGTEIDAGELANLEIASVKYTPQTLTPAQKEQARLNIEAVSSEDLRGEAISRSDGDNLEAIARQNADANLQTGLNNEATARQNADANLQTGLNNEATARQNADANLQTGLNNEATTRQQADTELHGGLADEITNRQAADATLQANIDAARSIAEGRSKARVFDTVEAMNTWLGVTANAATLNIGDNLLIRATDVPDYWWDGSTAQQLETQKVDLSSYVKNTRKINGHDLTSDVNLKADDINETSSRGWLTTALKTAYDGAVNWISTNGANLLAHLTNINNPHSVTKTQVGLSNVDNTSDANKPVSAAQQTALNAKQPAGNYPTVSDFGNTGPLTLTIGTGNKVTYGIPYASASSAGALSSTDWNNFNSKENVANKGVANGYAPLGFGAKIPMDYIPTDILENMYAYGILWIPANASPTLTRVGNMSLHASLPIQSKIRGCLLDDAGNVSMYLNPTNWNTTLDGSKGQVMVEIPEYYYKWSRQGDNRSMMISEFPLPGYKHAPKRYISAYEASIQRSTGKLCSVANSSEDYRGGDNTAAWDTTYRDLRGRPVTNLSRTAFRNAARLRGSAFDNPYGWNCLDYSLYKDVCWLFYIEYATFNSQESFAAKDSNGYATGGLGSGFTTMTNWGTYNNYNPMAMCGQTNSLGNGSGELPYAVRDAAGSVILWANVNRYRGIENLFGHIWKWVDGVNIHVIGGSVEARVSKTPESYSDSISEGYELRGSLPGSSGYMVSPIYMTQDNNEGDILPNTVGGSSSSYWCDYYYADNSWDGLHGLLVGGSASAGVSAGLACSYSSLAPSTASADFGSRLCFIP